MVFGRQRDYGGGTYMTSRLLVRTRSSRHFPMRVCACFFPADAAEEIPQDCSRVRLKELLQAVGRNDSSLMKADPVARLTGATPRLTSGKRAG